MQYIENQCPLCNTPAKYYFCDHKLWKYYNCPYCNIFFLLEDAEELLQSTPKDVKLKLSEDSHNNKVKENILVIEVSHHHQILHTEFRNRNLLPQC